MGDAKKIRHSHNSTMSLGDHLEELRARLLLAIVGLIVGSAVSLVFGTKIITFIEGPYHDAMVARVEKGAPTPAEPNTITFVERFFAEAQAAIQSDPNAPAVDPNQLAFWRKVSREAARKWAGQVNGTGVEAKAKNALPGDARLQTLAPAEAFTAYMKVSFIAGLILSSPWVFYQLWMFVATGLYPHERRYVYTAVPFSVVLFVTGALFFLFVVAPITLRFFLAFADLMEVASNWTLPGYISFVTVLMLVFGLAFQMPIAIFIVYRTGLVALGTLRSIRKYVVLAVFIIAAVVTPPDVISQVTLAMPLYALYELGIVLCWTSDRKKKAPQRDDPPSHTGE
jgi:sec-independent protein translocase protein TatC